MLGCPGIGSDQKSSHGIAVTKVCTWSGVLLVGIFLRRYKQRSPIWASFQRSAKCRCQLASAIMSSTTSSSVEGSSTDRCYTQRAPLKIPNTQPEPQLKSVQVIRSNSTMKKAPPPSPSRGGVTCSWRSFFHGVGMVPFFMVGG